MKAMDENEAKRYVKAIKIIHRYELSVPMRDSDRIIRIVNGEYKLNRKITPKILEDADKCITYLHFAQQLNSLRFTGDGKGAQQGDERPIRDDLKLGDTPAFYEKMGMEKLPLLYTRRHAIKALVPKAGDKELFRHNHGFSKKLMRQVPQLLEDPILVYNSPGHPDRICVVLNQVDNDRYPIVAILEPNSDKGVVEGVHVPKSNFLVSVYGKNNLDKQLAYKVPKSEVIYFDKEKSRGIERISGIQFPRDYSSLGSGTIIRVPRCIGNRDYTKSADRKGEKLPNRETNELVAAGSTARKACEAISKANRGTFRNTNRDAR